eukprot:gene15210-21287_t
MPALTAFVITRASLFRKPRLTENKAQIRPRSTSKATHNWSCVLHFVLIASVQHVTAGPDAAPEPKAAAGLKTAKVVEFPPKVVEDPSKVANTAKVVADPPKVFADPPKVVADPPKVVADPPKVVADPPKVVADPPKVVADLPKVVDDPPKVVVDPPIADPPRDPPKVVADPPKVVADPPKVVADPPKVVADPPKVVADPPKVANPAKVVDDPPKVVKDPPTVAKDPPKVDKTAKAVDDPRSHDSIVKGADDDKTKDIIGQQKDISVQLKNKTQEVQAEAKRPPRKKKAEMKSQIVTFAPAVEVTFGDDIDEDGKCRDEIAEHCEHVDDEGDGALADCVSDIISQGENSQGEDEDEIAVYHCDHVDEEGDGALADCVSDIISEGEHSQEKDWDLPDVSDECRDELYAYKISRDSNINKNIPLAKACKADADEFCNVTWFFGYKVGQVISCLRDVKEQVCKPCQKELFLVQKDAANDIRADPILWEACQDDTETLCKDVKPGKGRVQGCLRDNRMKLSWVCEEQLFRQEMENADDIRLSVRLFDRCLPDKRKFCKDIEPGNSRAKDCLEDNRAELSEPCKAEIDNMIERRVRDFRLDSKLRTACEDEIFNICAYFGDLDDVDTFDPLIVNCLQDYKQEIKNQKCVQQVKKYGSARVIRCLGNKRPSLSPTCRATLFDEEVRFSENIDFQFPMKAACKKELDKYCSDIPHGDARVLRCLQEKKYDKEFGRACLKEVQTFEKGQAQDYRLNYRLNKACKKTICGGKVLRCLTDKVDMIVDPQCKKICGGKVLCCLTDKVDMIVDPQCKKICGGKVLCCLTDKVDMIVDPQCKKMSRHPDTAWNELICGGKVLCCLTDEVDMIVDPQCKKVTQHPDTAGNEMIVDNLHEDCIAKRWAGIQTRKDTTASMYLRRELSRQQTFLTSPDHIIPAPLNPGPGSALAMLEVLYFEKMEVTDFHNDVILAEACRNDVEKWCLKVEPGEGRIHTCLREKRKELSEPCRKEELALEEKESESVELNVNLLQACKAERSLYCKAVAPGSARVFRCLAENIKDADFGSKCKNQVVNKLQRRQANWKLDPPLRKACKDDVGKYCSAADMKGSEQGLVYKCLTGSSQDLTSGCQRELGRALYMAFFVWQKDSILTKGCDDDIEKYCLAVRPSMESQPGAVGKCLAGIVQRQQARENRLSEGEEEDEEERRLMLEEGNRAPVSHLKKAKLSDECALLSSIAEPPSAKREFDASLSLALLANPLSTIAEPLSASLSLALLANPVST